MAAKTPARRKTHTELCPPFRAIPVPFASHYIQNMPSAAAVSCWNDVFTRIRVLSRGTIYFQSLTTPQSRTSPHFTAFGGRIPVTSFATGNALRVPELRMHCRQNCCSTTVTSVVSVRK
jgi:hypothetical protein